MRGISEKPSDMYSGASTVQKGIRSPVNLFRGNFFPREFVPCGTNSVGTTFFRAREFVPHSGNLFPVYLPYRTSRYFVLHARYLVLAGPIKLN